MKPLNILTLASITALALGMQPAVAETYPDKPVKVVVPFPAAGGTDTITRIVTDKLADVLDQPMVIENRGGGNTIIGAHAAATAPADGYTLMSTLDMTMTILPAVYQSLPFDPQDDFDPVSLLARVPALFVAHPSVPADNLQELIEYSKENPNELNYASAVLYGQLLGEQLKSVSGLTYTYVPYKGAAEAMNALVGGNVDFLMLDIATGLGFINDGKLKALAITSPERNPLLPDVPTVGESGHPELEMSVWYALYAPKGTPRDRIDTVNAGVREVLAMPEVQQRLEKLGHDAAPSTPEELAAMIQEDSVKWAKAAKDGNIRLD